MNMNRRNIVKFAAASGLAGFGGIASFAAISQDEDDPEAKLQDDQQIEDIDEELFEEIRTVLDAPPVDRDPRAAQFLQFLTRELPDSILRNTNVPVWQEFIELAETTAQCRTVRIGSSSLPNQHRTHRHGRFDYRVESRTARAVVFAEFCHPTINDIWNDVRNCAIGAATVAVITAVVTESPQAGQAIFYPIFYECLRAAIGQRAREVTVRLFRENEFSCWSNHCGQLVDEQEDPSKKY